MQACTAVSRADGKARAKGRRHVNWSARSTCGILVAYGLLRRVHEAAGVLKLSFGVDWRIHGVPDVDVPQARVPFGFIRAAGSYLAQAVLGEDRYWAAGGLEGAQGSRREQESSIPRSQDEDVAVALTVVQRPEIKKTLQTPRSKCKPVNPYASIPSRRTGVQPSHPYLRALRSISISISISLHAARSALRRG